MNSKTTLLLVLSIITMQFCSEKMAYDKNFNKFPIYEADNLGLNYSKEQSTFNIWAPTASSVRLNLYKNDQENKPTSINYLVSKEKGLWSIILSGNLIGQYYTFQIKHKGEWLQETPDIYAKAVGVNGKRAMVVDLASTNPKNWEVDKGPILDSPTGAIIYEAHIRDVSMHPSSGINNQGLFLGLAEKGTTAPSGLSTGLNHIKALGITHIHLLPVFDFLSIDESSSRKDQFNWGYDPLNYNTPEGSYASAASNGNTRVKEFKQMVKVLHNEGIGVIMDVVYNHTGPTALSGFNLTAPGYYYRHHKNGSFSNASACGNETASERPMMRKFMIESLKYWAQEYHIDGFRFDLMGIHDVTTMNLISTELKKINPSIILYGEGWTAAESPLSIENRAIKKNTHELNNIAAFNDDLRDGIKGPWSFHEGRGFVSGEKHLEESVKFGIVAATKHPQINYEAVNYSKAAWAKEPFQCINYVSCHDNHTLYDKLKISNPEEDEAALIKMHLLSSTIILTSQGIPFLHAGVELIRSKKGIENSYQSPDSINAIDWSLKSKRHDVFEYYRKLIALRKNHPAFRLPTNQLIRHHLRFLDFKHNNLVGYQIKDKPNGEKWDNILVIFNGNATEQAINIPAGTYMKIIADHHIDENGLGIIGGGSLKIAARSALVLVDSNSF